MEAGSVPFDGFRLQPRRHTQTHADTRRHTQTHADTRKDPLSIGIADGGEEVFDA